MKNDGELNIKLKRTLVHEQVFDYMKTAIHAGTWEIGGRIPAENDLAAKFGVNRLTVRMAVQRLIGMGLLESRVGDGTYVREFSFRSYVERASEFYLTPDLLDKICSYRAAIEFASARMAMENATPGELTEFGEMVRRWDELRQKYIARPDEELFAELLDGDVAIHAKICAMSHNDLFVYAFDMAREMIYKYIGIMLRDRAKSWLRSKRSGKKVYHNMHLALYDAIVKKDSEKCEKEYSVMIDYKITL